MNRLGQWDLRHLEESPSWATPLPVKLFQAGCVHDRASDVQHSNFVFHDRKQHSVDAVAFPERELPDFLVHRVVFRSDPASLRVVRQSGQCRFELRTDSANEPQ